VTGQLFRYAVLTFFMEHICIK